MLVSIYNDSEKATYAFKFWNIKDVGDTLIEIVEKVEFETIKRFYDKYISEEFTYYISPDNLAMYDTFEKILKALVESGRNITSDEIKLLIELN
jgi:hypothetical protein